MLTQHIALVPEAGGMNLSDLCRVSAALQRQLTEHLAPLWGISGTLHAFPYLEDMPAGYWPILVSPRALGPGAGVHLDEDGNPYARVELSASWSLEASRVCLDMLVNPRGDRRVTALSPRDDQRPVDFLVDVCGPCADATYSYVINDLLVADFCTPAFYGSAPMGARERYSFRGFVQEAFQVLPAGRLVWHDAVSDSWWLRKNYDQELVDSELGRGDRKGRSVRALLRGSDLPLPEFTTLVSEDFQAHARLLREQGQVVSQLRAEGLRALLRGETGARQAHGLPESSNRTEFKLSSGRLDSIFDDEELDSAEPSKAASSAERSPLGAAGDRSSPPQQYSSPPVQYPSPPVQYPSIAPVSPPALPLLAPSRDRLNTGLLIGVAVAIAFGLVFVRLERRFDQVSAANRPLVIPAQPAPSEAVASAPLAPGAAPAETLQAQQANPQPAAPAAAPASPTVVAQPADPAGVAGDDVRRRQRASRRRAAPASTFAPAEAPASEQATSIEDLIDSRR